jgi:Tol biopolymer transport system component
LEPAIAGECKTTAWSDPVNLGPPVNSTVRDSGATFSPDGLSLYFVSDRAGTLGPTDIWVSKRTCADCPWETPVNLAVVNSASSDGAPSLSTDGHLLFFQSDRPGGYGSSDIWVSRRANANDDFGWEAPVNLGPDVNTSDGEFSPDHVQSADYYLQNAGAPADAAALYFGRGPVANQDIYTAPLTRDGRTLGLAVLVHELNSSTNDAAASVRSDGKEVMFWSLRPGGFGSGDIWVSTRPNVHEPWSPPENVGSPVNAASNDRRPNLSRSGRTLLFDSNRPSGQGLEDIWMATRTPGCR